MNLLHTSVLLFCCQCKSCSCWVRLGAEGGLESLSCSAAGLVFLSTSSALKSGKFLLSRDLLNPKSESLIWPLRVINKLSGFISLTNQKKKLELHYHHLKIETQRNKNRRLSTKIQHWKEFDSRECQVKTQKTMWEALGASCKNLWT